MAVVFCQPLLRSHFIVAKKIAKTILDYICCQKAKCIKGYKKPQHLKKEWLTKMFEATISQDTDVLAIKKAPRLRDALHYQNIKLNLKLPSYKSFHGCILCQAQFVIQHRSSPVAVFGTLPELTAICTLKYHAVFLALVFKNTIAFF